MCICLCACKKERGEGSESGSQGERRGEELETEKNGQMDFGAIPQKAWL